MLNDRLKKVVIGEEDRVPIETDRGNLWFLIMNADGSWDAENINNEVEIIKHIKSSKVTNVFCVWHGNYRTNLFLIPTDNLIKRLENRLR